MDRQAPKIFLFEALSDEDKAAKLEALRRKVSHTQEKEDKDQARKETLKRGVLRSKVSFAEIWSDIAGEGGINIGDGWCRIFTLNKMGLLQVYCGTRLEERWLEPLSKEVRDFKDMCRWPEGTLPKSNPWKVPHFHRTVLALPTWHEDIEQFSVSFDGPIFQEDPLMSPLARKRREAKRRSGRYRGRGKHFSTLSYYFSAEIMKDPHHEGMWTPKRQKQAVPWERGDPVVPRPVKRIPSFFQPDEYDMEVLSQASKGLSTALSAKTHLIRKHRRDRPTLLPLDVKETIEFWLRSYGLDDHSK